MTSRDSLQSALSMSTTSCGPTVFSTSISWLQTSRMLGNCALILAVLKAVATAFLNATTSHAHHTLCRQPLNSLRINFTSPHQWPAFPQAFCSLAPAATSTQNYVL